MTIDEFVERNRIKNKKTVCNWIKKGYIPGSDEKLNFIPDSARMPYIEARAKKAEAIYNSIVKAACKRKHVFPELYGICDEEFQGYIDELAKAGLIKTRITDGITYYDATLKVVNNDNKFVLEIIKMLSEGATKGIMEVTLSAPV